MCYLCRYKEYKYSNNMYHFVIQAFIRYIHTHQVPITDLYIARDTFVETKYPLRTHQNQYKSAINNFIEHVTREEGTHVQDTVPTYRMNLAGEYKLLRGEEQ